MPEGDPPYTLSQLGSPLHYRPSDGGYVADCIPFFWDGVYHVFYLKRGFGGVPWAHLVSEDLVTWRELETALPLGAPDQPDGGQVFTGSVLEHEGTFHCFYTGHNEALPEVEAICHATSPDLVHWIKDPANPILRINPQWYERHDFRDPYVFWNEHEQRFWMLLATREAGCPVNASGALGLATSRDLRRWTLHPPLWTPRKLWCPECPDVFQAVGRWFLLYSTHVTCIASAPDPHGPWRAPPDEHFDGPRNYAVKRLWDGRRHVAFGWVASRQGETDEGRWEWGGHMAIPRELICSPEGTMRVRPVAEVLAAFSEEALTESELANLDAVTGEWSVSGKDVTGSKPDGRALARLPVPDSYLLTTEVSLGGPSVRASFALRASGDLAGSYAVCLEPYHHRVSLRRWGRYGPEGVDLERPVHFPTDRPTAVSIFVQGTVLEVFVDDQVGLSGRMYDRPSGDLGLVSENGPTQFRNLRIRCRKGE